MTSKNSLWKISLHNLKERAPMTVFCFLACFFTIFAPTLVTINELEYWEYDNLILHERMAGAFAALTPTDNVVMIVLVMLLAITMGVNAWLWNNSIRKVDFYKSLPVRESARWIYINVNSIVIFMVCLSFNILISLAVLAAKGYWVTGYVAKILTGIVMCMVLFTAVYMLTLIAQQLTGGPALAIALAVYLNTIEQIVISGTEELKDIFYDTYIFTGGDYRGFLTPLSIVRRSYNYGEQSRCIGMWQMTAVLLVQTIVYGSIAYYLYKKRASCAGNNNIAFNKTKPFLKIAVMIPGVVAFAMLFNEFDIMLFGFVCGVVVLQIVCQWILEGDFKCILKGKTALIISVLAAGGILAGFVYDISGFDAYVPVVGDVQYAEVAFDGEIYRNEYNMGREGLMRISEKECIEEIVRVVDKYVNNKPEKSDVYESSHRMFVSVTDKSGKNQRRVYEINSIDAYELYIKLYDCKEFREYEKAMFDDGIGELIGNNNAILTADYYQLKDDLGNNYGDVTLTFRADDVKEIWDCITADIEERNSEQINNSAVIGVFEARVEIPNETGVGIWENRDFVVYECDERMVDFLRNCNETYIKGIDDDVLYAEIKKYGTAKDGDILVCQITSGDNGFESVMKNILLTRYVDSDTYLDLSREDCYYITLFMKDGRKYDFVPLRKNVIDKDGTMIYSN